MAPTTVPGQVTTTTPYGRDPALTGKPVDIMKLLSTIDNTAYLRRSLLAPQPLMGKKGLVYQTRNILDAKKTILNAFKVQEKGGYSLIEFMSTCNINWKMTVEDSKHYLYDTILKQYPPGLYKDRFGIEKEGVATIGK